MESTLGALGLAVCPAGASSATAVSQPRLTVDGTELVLTLDNGRTLRSQALQGATLRMRTETGRTEVTIMSVEEDPDAVGGRVLLHRFVTRDAGGRVRDLCLPDAEGRSRGFPVADGRGGFELTCTSGAMGKCVRWGYRPWEERPGEAPPQGTAQGLRAHGARRLWR